jgi:nicotinamidase-related amidase
VLTRPDGAGDANDLDWSRMSEKPNLMTPDNSVLILIDHQPWVAFSVESINRSLLVNNVTGLATAAKALGVPTILTTVGANRDIVKDPMFHHIRDVFPEQTPIDRLSTNAWADIQPAVEATGRRVLLMAGIWTEVCLAETVLTALSDGYTVFFVSDCSGGVSKEAHEDAKQRMVQAGANGINWIGAVAEWTPDYTSPQRQAVNPGLIERGSGVGLSVEYVRANR